MDLFLLSDIRVHFEACLEKVFKVLELVRFPVEGWHRGGHGFW